MTLMHLCVQLTLDLPGIDFLPGDRLPAFNDKLSRHTRVQPTESYSFYNLTFSAAFFPLVVKDSAPFLARLI